MSGTFQVYDNFDAPGYSLTRYAERWILPYALGEMAVNDTRDFSGAFLSLSAVPFQTASDASVNDHLKYMAVSSQTFSVPKSGTLVLSSDVKASTPGTGNVSNPDCHEATEVGIDKMYTQIIREVPVRSDAWHHVDIALTRYDGDAWVDYFLDREPIAHVGNIGIPLDKQGAPFTGIYPTLGSGERLADQLDSVRFGHGLFSLLDAFPFQHPGAPELSVSIPALTPPAPSAAGQTRLFGQGASGAFDNFTTLTISDDAGPASPSEIATALAAAHG